MLVDCETGGLCVCVGGGQENTNAHKKCNYEPAVKNHYSPGFVSMCVCVCVCVCQREREIVSIQPVNMHECIHECCRAFWCCRACVRACHDWSCLIEFDTF